MQIQYPDGPLRTTAEGGQDQERQRHGRALLRLLVASKPRQNPITCLKFPNHAGIPQKTATITPSAMRRGGTMFRVTQFGSIDLTTSYGGSALAVIPHRYISQAASDLATVELPLVGVQKAARCAQVLPTLLNAQLAS